MKKNSNSQTKSGQKTKPAKVRGPVQRDSKEVIAELVAKLSERLEQKPTQEKAAEARPRGVPAPNRDRLTVGLDLGDQCRMRVLYKHKVWSLRKDSTNSAANPHGPIVAYGSRCNPPRPDGDNMAERALHIQVVGGSRKRAVSKRLPTSPC